MLFDHEEVGSESTTGAAGPLLEHVLERLALATGAGRSEFLAQLAASWGVRVLVALGRLVPELEG